MEQQKFPFVQPMLLDGATGTELLRRGMHEGEVPERFILEHPAVLGDLQNEYRAAGADAVLAPTFGANRPTLLRHGYRAEEADDICRALVDVTRSQVPGVKIGGDVSPTGLLLQPYGEARPEEAFAVYQEQAASLLRAGVDFFMIETMIAAAEARLALRAVRSLSADVPVFVSMTVNENGRTMNGDALDAVFCTILPYHVQAFGCNCSIGPDVIARALRPVAPLAKRFGMPLLAKPNAGMPVTDADGNTHFPLTPAAMAGYAAELTGLGVGVFGGCCGTTPAHIEAIAHAVRTTETERCSAVEEADVPDMEALVSTARLWAVKDPAADYLPVDGDSEDDLYDWMDEHDEDDILYLELGNGAADLLIRMDAFLPNPIAVQGDEAEILRVEENLCRKVR